MPASSANSRTTDSTRNRRLPLTPSVVSNRRGGHAATRPARTAAAPASASATPAMHVTPNVVSAARGGLTQSRRNRLSDAYKAGALDMRGLRL